MCISVQRVYFLNLRVGGGKFACFCIAVSTDDNEKYWFANPSQTAVWGGGGGLPVLCSFNSHISVFIMYKMI